MSSSHNDFAELHDELRSVARDMLGTVSDADKSWRQVGDSGWLGLEIPDDLDGAGATFAETAVVLEEQGRAATPGPFFGTAVLAVPTLLAAQPSTARDDLLRQIATGQTGATAALAAHGDSATAHPPFVIDAAGVLRGSADYVIDAPAASHILLLADAGDRGLVLVHVAAEQVEVTPEPVLDTTRSLGRVRADGVPVPTEAIWPLVDDPTTAAQQVLDRAAVALAVDAMGVAGAMLETTVAYVSVRHQFDRPIGSFQAVKHQCADALVSLRVGRELLDAAVAAAVSGADDLDVAAARAKSYLGAAAVEVVGTAMQLHGGIGYTWESGIHTYLKRAMLDRSLVGSPAMHRRRLAARLLASST